MYVCVSMRSFMFTGDKKTWQKGHVHTQGGNEHLAFNQNYPN